MDYVIPKQTFNGRVNEVILGVGERSLAVGGDASYPFHFFEGSIPNRPRFALEVLDLCPTDWADGAMEPFADVSDSPVKWAKKCVDSYGAEAICLQLPSIDPDKENRSPREVASVVKDVVAEVDVPIIVYGTGNEKKDAQVLEQVAKECSKSNLFLGPVQEKNLSEIAKSAAEFGHGVIIQTPLEINPAREMNIKLKEFLSPERIIYDPFSMAVGYGIEFTFTIMERVRQGAILVNDVNVQMPLFANIGKECWISREARKSREQGIIMEAISGMALLLAGANILVLRHPESYHLLKAITERVY
jgi:acetyl-CoA decarbonylase/synthase complex subunit delta